MTKISVQNNIEKHSHTKHIFAAVFAFIFLGLLILNTNINIASANDCGTSGVRSEVYVRGTYAFVSVSNDNGNCSVPVNLKSYKMYDTVLSNQTLYADASMTVGPNSTKTLNVDIPQCVTQIDAYLGNGPTIPAPGYNILSWTFASNGVDVGHGFPSSNYCTRPTPPPPPPPVIPTLDGSCSASPTSINTGGSISWSASASGGTDSYTYSWSGTDGLTGTGSTASQVYSSAGAKTATVTITSGSQSVTRSCNATVNTPVQNLVVSCYPTNSNVQAGNNITWNTSVSGGTGSYNYSWSGTDNLYGTGSVVSQYYSQTGTKNALVTVTSGGQTASASCSANVNQVYSQNFTVSCYANPNSPYVNTGMTWNAYASGGNGNYSYSWTGSDGLNSYNQNPYMTYYSTGNKYASVTVTSNGQTVSASCNANVLGSAQVLSYVSPNNQVLSEAVSLSAIPYTGLAEDLMFYVFIALLVLWSAYVAYLFLKHQMEEEQAYAEDLPVQTVAISSQEGLKQIILDEAKKHRVLVSDRAVGIITKKALGNKDEAMSILKQTIKNNSGKRNENSWLAVGEEDVK